MMLKDFSEVLMEIFTCSLEIIMRILTETHLNDPIKKVKFEALKPANDEFSVDLEVRHTNAIGFKVGIVLCNGGDHLNVSLRDVYLPDKIIPKFAIAFDCFQAQPDAAMDQICEEALSNVLNEDTSIIFTRDGDKVMIHLKIGLWRNDGMIDLKEVSDYLIPK